MKQKCVGRKEKNMKRRLLPAELEKEIGANVVSVEVTETEEEASEMRIMQLHLGDARDRGPRCPT